MLRWYLLMMILPTMMMIYGTVRRQILTSGWGQIMVDEIYGKWGWHMLLVLLILLDILSL